MGNKVLERLAADRTHTNELIDEILAAAEADERSPSDSEREQISRFKIRLAELEPQIVEQAELEEHRQSSRDVHELLNRAGGDRNAHGNGDGPQLGGPLVQRATGLRLQYNTAGQFVVDYLKARGGLRGHGNEQMQPDAAAIERVGPWLDRAMENQTTADTPGLLPAPVIGPVLAQKLAVQPFVSSIGGAKPMGGIPGKQFSRPKITQHTLVGLQTAEKTELPSRKMVIGGIPFSKVTKGGVVDISRQDMDWSVPSAWDILLSDLAAVYGEEVENECADDCAAKSLAGTPAIAVATNTLDDWAKALYAAAARVYSNTTPRRLPNRLWMSLDVWANAGPVIDVALIKAGAQLAELMASQGAASFAGNMFALPRYVVPSFATGICVVGVDTAYEVYEEVVGVLSAVEPALFGVQVAYGGYVAFNAVEPEGLVKITPPAGG